MTKVSTHFLLKRLSFHLLLAIFLANAANKFFIPNLETEAKQHFYEQIFNFQGNAPDQYRILPLLAIKGLRSTLQFIRPEVTFHHVLLVFNFICGFLIFEGFFRLLTTFSERKGYLFNLIFAIVFIYTLYTGWRPDTLGLLLICTFYCVWWNGQKTEQKTGISTFVSHLFFIVTLAFSRSDIAAIYAIFFAFTFIPNWPQRLLLVSLPFAVQYLLQFHIFKSATYYTTPIMVWDNLSGYYLAMNPATWLIAALILLFYKELYRYVVKTYQLIPLFYWLLLGYLGLVFIMGRLNEYRLYLPFLPLWMIMHSEVKDRLLALPKKPSNIRSTM